jgi:hypothetical protein
MILTVLIIRREFLLATIEFKESRLTYHEQHIWSVDNKFDEILIIGLRGKPLSIVLKLGEKKDECKFDIKGQVVKIEVTAAVAKCDWSLQFKF